MFSKSPNYRKLWTDYGGPVSRDTAYAYWAQARRFEQAAHERGDAAAANYQARTRLERENRLLEWDAMEGGNI